MSLLLFNKEHVAHFLNFRKEFGRTYLLRFLVKGTG